MPIYKKSGRVPIYKAARICSGQCPYTWAFVVLRSAMRYGALKKRKRKKEISHGGGYLSSCVHKRPKAVKR